MKNGRPPKPPFERFAEKIQLDEQTGCWNWIGAKSHAGYGIFVINSRRMVACHRVSILWFVEPLKPEHHVHHNCRNPACCNPHHLQQVPKYSHSTIEAAAKTHCVNGHEYKDGSYYISRVNGWRHCYICKRKRERDENAKRRVLNPKPHPNSAKTHCSEGHEFTEVNTYRDSRGSRRCRVCMATKNKRWKELHKKPPQPRKQRARQTHCKRGHVMNEDTVYLYHGRRACAVCHNQRQRMYDQRRKEAEATAQMTPA